MAINNKKKAKSLLDMILMYILFGAFPIIFNENHRKETAIVVALLILFAIINALLAFDNDIFIFKAILLSINPLTFGFLEMAIGVWMVAFVPHWTWTSILLGTFWGIWLLPIFLPKLSTKVEVEIMHPKSALGKWVIGILIGMGGFGGAASGRLASRAVKNGDNWGAIFLGLGIASFAFILQYAFVHQAWNGRLEAKKNKESK
jgi:sugar phosphate permease